MSPFVLLCGMLLDAVFGEPKWLWSRMPHPAVMMGSLVSRADKTLNRDSRISGAIALILLIACGLVIGWTVQLGGTLAEIIVVAILLAQKSLVEHVSRVARDLRMSVQQARRSVGMIVSRETREMQSSDIARAAIESGAENLSDGVIAPAFWALVGGLPGLVVYKLVNTADSMIGYRTPRHENFGWAAAKLDDVMNWIPARLTAAIFWISGGLNGSWNDIRDDAKLHKSPNAGWPEAALSRSLGVALAGPRQYHGTLQDLPWVNGNGRRNTRASDIDAACTRLWHVWGIFVIVLMTLSPFF